MLEKSDIKNRWLEKLELKKAKKKKSYLHFDNKIKDHQQFLPLISSPKRIAKHSFLPFIKFDKPKYKYKKVDGKRILIKKENGKLKVREIMYAGHLDALIYIWYQTILENLYEQALKKMDLESVVLAYRQILDEKGDGKCNINFAHEVFTYIRKKGDDTVALAFDIENFFPSLSHTYLKEKWCEILGISQLTEDHYNVFKSLTKYSYINLDKDVKKILKISTPGQKAHSHKNNLLGLKKFSGVEFRKLRKLLRSLENEKRGVLVKNVTSKGIPQGSPLSGLLANIYLLDFDREMNRMLTDAGGIYRRYSDDVIVVCSHEKAKKIESELKELISAQKDLNGVPFLSVKDSKTHRILFKQDKDILKPYSLDEKHENLAKRKVLQYLGFEFDGENVFLRSGSVAKFYNQLNSRIKRLKKHFKYGPLLKRKLFRMHTPLGKRNFFSYLNKAKKIISNNKFDRQLRKHWPLIKKKIEFLEKRSITG